MQKKNKANIQPSAQMSLVNKQFNILKKNTIFLRDTVGNPKWQDSTIVPPLVQHKIWFILPVHGPSYIINVTNIFLDTRLISSTVRPF